MTIYLGADHKGFALKEALKPFLQDQGYEVADLGAAAYNKDDDYPLFAAAVGRHLAVTPERSRGIVVCGSGAGVAIAINKFKHVRALLASSTDQVYEARNDDDINALALAADFTNEEDAKKLVDVFLATPFGKSDRAVRRLLEIAQIEDETALK